MACPATPSFIKGCDYAQFLVHQTPIFDKSLTDIRPGDGWPGKVNIGVWDPFTGVQKIVDRYNHVFPDITRAWTDMTDVGCDGSNPCDPVRNCLGLGSTRTYYGLEQQSWSTQLFCFDLMMTITNAREHMKQFQTDILKPATENIMSNFIRKRAFTTGTGKHWVADANMTDFVGNFITVNGAEIFFDTNVAPTSKITPQMLQNRVSELMANGYMGKNPFKDEAPFIELVTDMETTWDLDKQICSGGNTVANNWRFTQWEAANSFWRYGFSGQLGNYAIRVDPNQLRFCYVGFFNGLFRYQVVPPYVNVVSSGGGVSGAFASGAQAGLRSIPNPLYKNARYALSFIWHKEAMEIQVLGSGTIGAGTEFKDRNFRGMWTFANHDLGADCNGVAIDNSEGNKGRFQATFKLAAKPMHTEFAEAIFHQRNQHCIVTCAPCGPEESCYPQNLTSCNCSCSTGCTDENDCP